MLAQPVDQAWHPGDRAATRTAEGIGRQLLTRAADHSNPPRHTGNAAATETTEPKLTHPTRHTPNPPEPKLIHLAWRAGNAAATTESPEGGDR